MAAAASGLDARFIEWHMPLDEALQYQALWLEMEGNVTALLESSVRRSDRL